MKEERETFHYTYLAKQQEEIRNIREKYQPREESKLERLRKLDESVTRPGAVVALAVGIVSILILGIGMSMTMVWEEQLFVPGIIIGVIGILGVSAAYPLYSGITKSRRKKLAPEIIRLTEELMQ